MRSKIYKFIGIITIAIIVFSVFLILSKKQKNEDLFFVSSIPKNNERLIFQRSEIIITFNRNITEEDGKNLEVKISPEENINKVYQENKIRINPETEFQINTDYKIEVIYKNKDIYTLAFTTIPVTQQQLQEDGAKQTEADLAFNENYEKFLIDYPWYTELPIEKSNYRIIYDFEKKSFRIR